MYNPNFKFRITKNIHVADFETNKTEWLDKWQQPIKGLDKAGQVYAWAFKNKDTTETGVSVDSFLDHIINYFVKKITKGRINVINKKTGTKKPFRRKLDIWFHNGSNFDFHFIIKALKTYKYKGREFKHKLEKVKETTQLLTPSGYRSNIYQEPDRPDFVYSYLVDDKRKMYVLNLFINQGQCITFRCSALVFGKLKLAEMGRQLNNKKLQKQELDYDIYREYKDNEALKNDRQIYDYLISDVNILYEWLNLVQNTVLPYSKWKITRTRTGYLLWLESLIALFFKFWPHRIEINTYNPMSGFTTYLIKNQKDKYVKHKDGRPAIFKPHEVGAYFLKQIWPAPNEKVLQETPNIRNWYEGGLTTVNPDYVGTIASNINYIDVNMSYASIMKSDTPLPYGDGVVGDGGKDYPFKFYRVIIKKEMTQSTTLPFMYVKNKLGSDYKYTLKPNDVFYLLTPIYEKFIEHYKPKKSDCKVFVDRSYKTHPANSYFGHFVNYWTLKIKQAKLSNDPLAPFIKHISKGIINSIYGRLATKVHRFNLLLNTETNIYEAEETLGEYENYLPAGMAITAYARLKLINTNVPRTLFGDADTDKITYRSIIWKPQVKISQEIGDWKLEHENVNALFLRKKGYLLWKGDKFEKKVLSGFYFDNNAPIYDYQHKVLTSGREGDILDDRPAVLVERFITGRYFMKQLQRQETTSGVDLIETKKYGTPVWNMCAWSSELWFTDQNDYANKLQAQLDKVGGLTVEVDELPLQPSNKLKRVKVKYK